MKTSLLVVAILIALWRVFFHAANLAQDKADAEYEKNWLAGKMNYRSFYHRFHYARTRFLLVVWSILLVWCIVLILTPQS